MRFKNLGMPYMGSKRKLSTKIVDEIINANPNVKYIYDLFSGGGSISFEAIQRPQIKKVVYNELNTGVVALLQKIQKDGITDEFYQWVDRETFIKHKNGIDWFGGLCKVVWSFGNNQKDYLFGKEVEEIKKILHEVVVFENQESLDEINKRLKMNLKMNVGLFKEDMHQRRLRMQREIIKEKDSREGELQQLQRLQQLQQLQRLEISNKSYELVEVNTPVDETIIYLDPPYDKTAKYQSVICHNELMEYIKNSPYKIYMSSYESELPCVLELKHRSSLSATANIETVEKLFCNRGGGVEMKERKQEVLFE